MPTPLELLIEQVVDNSRSIDNSYLPWVIVETLKAEGYIIARPMDADEEEDYRMGCTPHSSARVVALRFKEDDVT